MFFLFLVSGVIFIPAFIAGLGLISPFCATCGDFRIHYNEHPSFWAGIRSHFRWLRRMGTPITIA